MSNFVLLLYVITTSSGLVVMKLGTRVATPAFEAVAKLPVNVSWLTLSGIMLYGISFLLYIYLVSKFDLGYVIPLTASLVYIVVFLASFFILKEPFTAAKIVGILLILLGLYFLNQGK